MLLSAPSYRDVLRSELERRQSHNPRYSIRGFARFLGLSPSTLCETLKGHHSLSLDAAPRVAERLGLRDEHAACFKDMVEAECLAISEPRREAAARRVALRKAHLSEHQVREDAFRSISDWYHFALLELTQVADFEPTTAWIASALGIDEALIREAVERLERLDLLVVDEGGMRLSHRRNTAGGVPSEAVRAFHHQILAKAQSALTTQSMERRYCASVVMALDEDGKQEIRAKLKDLAQSAKELCGKPGPKTELYCLSTQFFDLRQDGSLHS